MIRADVTCMGVRGDCAPPTCTSIVAEEPREQAARAALLDDEPHGADHALAVVALGRADHRLDARDLERGIPAGDRAADHAGRELAADARAERRPAERGTYVDRVRRLLEAVGRAGRAGRPTEARDRGEQLGGVRGERRADKRDVEGRDARARACAVLTLRSEYGTRRGLEGSGRTAPCAKCLGSV